MYLFTLTALPVFVFGWICSHEKGKRNAYVPPVIWGAVTGALTCFVIEFFVFSNFNWTENFYANYMHFFIFDTLIPCAALYLVFIIFSKDTCEYKLEAFLPLMLSFYAVFLPYRIFSMGEQLSFFPLFAKPLICISFTVIFCYFLQFIRLGFINRKIFLAILYILFDLAFPFVPAFLEVYWHMGADTILWACFSGAFILIGVVVLVSANSFKKRRSPAAAKSESGEKNDLLESNNEI